LTGLSYSTFDRAFVFNIWQGFRIETWYYFRTKNIQDFRIVFTGFSYWNLTLLSYQKYTRLSYRFYRVFVLKLDIAFISLFVRAVAERLNIKEECRWRCTIF
jgi:hypothetical protein